MYLKLYVLIEWKATKPNKGNKNNKVFVCITSFVNIGINSKNKIDNNTPADKLSN